MSNSADLVTHFDAINALSEEHTVKCAMSMATYIAEAETLEKVATEDKEALAGKGLDWTKVESLKTLTGATREAQSLWMSDRFSKEGAQESWDEKEGPAQELLEECLHDFYYAFRGDEHLIGRVQQIEEGSDQADFVQDLNDSAVLGRENSALLEAINFDMTKLDAASTYAREMAELLAAKESSSDKNDRRVVRDKAFSLLKVIVDEVYACGQYVFWKNPDRKRLYSSAYRRAYNKRMYRKKQDGQN